MKGAYYNEIDPYCAGWLRNLIAAGHIANGDVDERSIIDVRPDDLSGYIQCHFFAGISGWSLALRLAGWDDDRPCWSGSCPCQPLSVAGQRRGHADERHLWPAFYRLIAECRPAVVFGEQIAGKDGREWLAAVRADLEGCGYAVGAADLCAAGVGAPHIRQRLWFVADANGRDAGAERLQRGGEHRQRTEDGGAGELADSIGSGLEVEREQSARRQCAAAQRGGEAGELGDAAGNDQCRSRLAETGDRWQAAGRSGPWSDCDWLPCIDGKARPVEPGIFPLAHGVPGRMAKLRAIGNAIVPPLAAEFIVAFMDARRARHDMELAEAATRWRFYKGSEWEE